MSWVSLVCHRQAIRSVSFISFTVLSDWRIVRRRCLHAYHPGLVRPDIPLPEDCERGVWSRGRGGGESGGGPGVDRTEHEASELGQREDWRNWRLGWIPRTKRTADPRCSEVSFVPRLIRTLRKQPEGLHCPARAPWRTCLLYNHFDQHLKEL